MSTSNLFFIATPLPGAEFVAYIAAGSNTTVQLTSAGVLDNIGGSFVPVTPPDLTRLELSESGLPPIPQTPIPGDLPLFASVLGLGGFFRWKRKRKTAMA